jgi:hypothetical protein
VATQRGEKLLNLNQEGLSKLDSMTKYPSIGTYHALDPATGMLQEDKVTSFVGTVVVTEKIDGCNARIILLPNGTYILGSRDTLLYAQGDLIQNPAHGIVDTLKNIGERIAGAERNNIMVIFGEVYGIGNGPWGNYTSRKEVGGFRVFDVMTIDNWPELMGSERARLALWRESGGQQFYAEPGLTRFTREAGLELVPRLLVDHREQLPTTLQDTLDWMSEILPESQAKLSPGGSGTPEGVVIRSWARSIIVKARFKDYRSTLRRSAQNVLREMAAADKAPA